VGGQQGDDQRGLRGIVIMAGYQMYKSIYRIVYSNNIRELRFNINCHRLIHCDKFS